MCVWPGPVDGKLPPANFFADLASHPEDGPYYWERSAWTKLDDIDIPVLSVVFQLNFIHSCSQLDSHSRLKGPKKLLVVPPAGWFSHLQFLRNRPLNEQILRWLDHWLKGIDTGIMDEPPVAIYDTGKEEWRYENEYPLARTGWKRFYLHSSSKGPATEPPCGLLSTEPPEREEPDRYASPESLSMLREGKPVLTYATPPLDADITVWGPLSTVIYGSSTGLDTTWFVKLRDVGPDGKVTLLSQGNLKASYREVDKGKSKPGQPFHQFQNPVLLEPDTVYEFQIEMVPIFYTFKKGHRIWVHIASDDLVHYSQFHLLPIHAENTIYHDKTYPSHLVLPVIPDAPVVKSVGPPLSEIKWPVVPGTGTPFAPFFTGTPHT
ncbi:MAG: CocE/NonD family hydrolase, partial [Dehalococcoidia bacterium]|nr:CocE/NonD family hydrolase [Dehalococcoidia bacterium]